MKYVFTLALLVCLAGCVIIHPKAATVPKIPVVGQQNPIADHTDPRWVQWENIPIWARERLLKANADFILDTKPVRPLYVRGDFSGNKRPDIALIGKTKSGLALFVIHDDKAQPYVVPLKQAPQFFGVLSRSENLLTESEAIVIGPDIAHREFVYWNGIAYQREPIEYDPNQK